MYKTKTIQTGQIQVCILMLVNVKNQISIYLFFFKVLSIFAVNFKFFPVLDIDCIYILAKTPHPLHQDHEALHTYLILGFYPFGNQSNPHFEGIQSWTLHHKW